MSDDEERPDPRFLGGEVAVLTDASKMALVIAIDWNGAVDIMGKIPPSDAAAVLRQLVAHFEERAAIEEGPT